MVSKECLKEIREVSEQQSRLMDEEEFENNHIEIILERFLR